MADEPEKVEMKGIFDFAAIGKGISSGFGQNVDFWSRILGGGEPEPAKTEPEVEPVPATPEKPPESDA